MSEIVRPEDIERAIREVEKEVLSLNNPKDTSYFQYHKKRFLRMATRMVKELPKGSRILDIGSHFLHPAMILTKLGYRVYGVDVPVFFEVEFINDRRNRYGIEGICERDLESFEAMEGKHEDFDAVLFTEILEHITFNPLVFWKRTYEVLKPGGLIYITTPNSLALPSLVRTFGRLLSLRGIGIKVSEIMQYETYGHHWKEYSRAEIRQYFHLLSDDFEVQTRFFSFHQGFGSSLRDRLWYGMARLGLWLYFFAPCLESVVRVHKEKGFKLSSPEYH